ncbi:MAG: FAD binding domain-containing protein [Cyanomargarita calcarea GSE-NOS-MK-12-04C]|jgi:CO/xanthine dehydrogenase FAD-binding subunit|uniref:FAD binding domain-containing protein n=1 Tax=Cyanomargarita calcarea GSE-NOS-MK-12-04C TaxID=2839659 RepID=A0A951QN61_9CYAN|nr:FAD binding domain-containing protein [Cyanomargarita calcarea GSE-NOS-MK-12-04C]
MDLPNIEAYLRPKDIENITEWSENWAWLAGGTWLFSEPQPHLVTLVDMQSLGWSKIEIEGDNLVIGATCPLIKLLEHSWLPEWTAIAGLKSAVSALAASLKVINMATVGGNICLALSVGTLAPVMVTLGANYEILNLKGELRQVGASSFQIGFKKTILQPGEVLRRVLIPLENLKWKVSYQRFSFGASDPAYSIVVSAYNPKKQKFRVAIGASVVAPILLEFDGDVNMQNINFIGDAASAAYRREITTVLIRRSLDIIEQ